MICLISSCVNVVFLINPAPHQSAEDINTVSLPSSRINVARSLNLIKFPNSVSIFIPADLPFFFYMAVTGAYGEVTATGYK
ncbi:MAG: hypothetical protein [Inoviridae sp.]|nr:MAG: hypothetical protein [Inoviridae sp.]